MENITEKHIGKEVVMFREPTEIEWLNIGKVSLELIKELKILVISSYVQNKGFPFVRIEGDSSNWAYPACIFKLKKLNNTYEIY